MDWDPAERSPGRNYHFLTSAVAPRPIAWTTTVDPATGVVNAAPFSWFQAVCAGPPMVMLSLSDRADGSPKDTLRNLRAQGEFVVNAVDEASAKAMVATSAEMAPEVSEPEELGLELVPSKKVRPPRLAASPFHLECRLDRTIRLGNASPTTLVLGEVVHLHARDEVLDERGNIDNTRVPLVARLGGQRYVAVHDLFEVPRPGPEDALRRR